MSASACSRCSSACSSSTTRSRLRSRERRWKSAFCARSARRAAQIRWLFLGESAVTGLLGSLAGIVGGHRHRARYRRLGRRPHQRRLWRCAASRRRVRDARGCSRRRSAIGIVTSVIAALDSGARGGARRSGPGAAKRQVSGRCHPARTRARLMLAAVSAPRRRLGCLLFERIARAVLCELCAGDRGRDAADALPLAWRSRG